MQAPGNQTFVRGNDRILGGVCSGLAEGFHVEALWVRLAFVILAFLNGVGILLYIVLWVLMPEQAGYRPPGKTVFESMSSDVKRAWIDVRAQFGGARPATTSAPVDPTIAATSPEAPAQGQPVGAPPPPPPPQTSVRNPSFILGAILIVIGIAFLAANTGFINWSILWPVALVALGIALLVRNMEKRS
jgi:phage shock protein PspC (stress-responsive transcriptional regulator)